MEEFFDKLQALNYPQEKTDVYITCQSQEKLEFVQNVVKSWIENDIYQSVTLEKDFKGIKDKHLLSCAMLLHLFYFFSEGSLRNQEFI